MKNLEMIVRLLFIAFILMGCDDEFDKTMLNESTTPVPNISSGPAPTVDTGIRDVSSAVTDAISQQNDGDMVDARVPSMDATSDASQSLNDGAVSDSVVTNELDAEGLVDSNVANTADAAE